MFKKLAAAVSVTALLAATPAFAHGYGWHRGPGIGPLVALGVVTAATVGAVALAAQPPAVVYAPPPAYYPPPGYYAAPPAYYAPTPAPYNQ
jgi:hypothetical protein